MSDLGFIHRFVPAADAKAPVLLLLHGTGGNEEDLLPLGAQVLPGAALLGVRGKVLENGMPRFFRRLAEGVFDLDDLRLRTVELAQFLENARAEYGWRGRKLVALGYSNGANIAASLLLSGFPHLGGAILLRAMVPFEPEPVPQVGPIPVLLSAGRRDPIVPMENLRRLGELLANAGANVTFHWHEGGHELGRDDLDAAREWLRDASPRILGGSRGS